MKFGKWYQIINYSIVFLADGGYSPWSLVKNLWNHNELIWQLVKRDLSQRYRGTYLGMLWAFITPLLMLLTYTFVFSFVFKARWREGLDNTSMAEFALILFAGLIPFNLFSEVVTRSPSLILNVPNYVKKVVFPLEILPLVTVISAMLHSLFSIAIMLLASLVFLGYVSSMALLLPLAYTPLLLLALAFAFCLSSIGVYLRDIGQAVGVAVNILFFLSPVFYPVSAVPASLRWLFNYNPLTLILTGFREILLWQSPLHWRQWLTWTGVLILLNWFSYIWFMKSKKGFADVL